jgi:hypothetical protein
MARKLEKSEWSAFLNRFDKGLSATRAEIDVTSLNLGDKIQAEWVPLIGIVYDPKDDIVEVAVEGLDHMVHRPRDYASRPAPGATASTSWIGSMIRP